MTIGEQIKQYRMRHGLTQKDFAARIPGARQKDVSRWENGIHAPQLETYEKIKKVLGG